MNFPSLHTSKHDHSILVNFDLTCHMPSWTSPFRTLPIDRWTGLLSWRHFAKTSSTTPRAFNLGPRRLAGSGSQRSWSWRWWEIPRTIPSVYRCWTAWWCWPDTDAQLQEPRNRSMTHGKMRRTNSRRLRRLFKFKATPELLDSKQVSMFWVVTAGWLSDSLFWL